MPEDRAAEDDLLQVFSLSDQILERVAMAHPDRVLLNNRTLVEIFGHVMAGRADDLHAFGESLMVRIFTRKRRQK